MTLAGDLVFGAYALAGRLGTPLAARYLRRRVGRGKEDPARLDERWGRASAARPRFLTLDASASDEAGRPRPCSICARPACTSARNAARSSSRCLRSLNASRTTSLAVW